MGNDPDYILDIASLSDEPPVGERPAAANDPARRWLGVQFECCGAYARIYQNRQATAYVGHCPHCSRSIRIPIGPEGTSCRFFRAS